MVQGVPNICDQVMSASTQTYVVHKMPLIIGHQRAYLRITLDKHKIIHSDNTRLNFGIEIQACVQLEAWEMVVERLMREGRNSGVMEKLLFGRKFMCLGYCSFLWLSGPLSGICPTTASAA